MPNPTYTTLPQDVRAAASDPNVDGDRRSLSAVLDGWLAMPAARSPAVHATIDLAIAGLIVLSFARAADPDVLFHVIFVLLVVHAFLFGVRGTLLRIGLVAVVILLYALGASAGLGLGQHDLAEWPLMFLIAILVALMADWREATARHFEALFRRASDRLLAVQEDERRRFARELHDGVGQTLTALTLGLDAAGDGSADPAITAERVASARRLAHDALLEAHDLATRLRPARIEHLGLARALRDLAQRAGCEVELDIEPDAARSDLVPTSAAVEIYRIVQEALANVARHSGAAFATVNLAVRDGALRAVVADSGRGFDSASVRDGGLGLTGIRERAALLGAALDIDSAPGAGTRISLWVPLAKTTPR